MSLSDVTEISNLVYRYAECIDDGDFPGVAALFAQGSVVGPDGQASSGYDEVLALYRNAARIYPDTGTPCTQHVTTNLIVDIDADGRKALARSYFSVLQALEDFPLQVIIAGRYRDEFALQEGRWVFHRREIHPTLLGDLSRHLVFDQGSLSGA